MAFIIVGKCRIMVLFSRGKNELSFTFAYIRYFDSEKKI